MEALTRVAELVGPGAPERRGGPQSRSPTPCPSLQTPHTDAFVLRVQTAPGRTSRGFSRPTSFSRICGRTPAKAATLRVCGLIPWSAPLVCTARFSPRISNVWCPSGPAPLRRHRQRLQRPDRQTQGRWVPLLLGARISPEGSCLHKF